MKRWAWLDQLWAIGRRSNVAYIRFYPNPGFMLPLPGGKRLRWSIFYGARITRAPGA